VILAGGQGTRLWPLAGAERPKPFLALGDGKSLFRQTYERVVPLVGRGRVLVVAGGAHARWIRLQAPDIPARNVIFEEIGRNTAASVALAALWIRSRAPDGIMVVLPSDHWVAPVASFRATLSQAVRAALAARKLVLVGVAAQSPETGLGYIVPGPTPTVQGTSVVRRFIEKPPVTLARRLIRRDHVLWNSGIFVWRAAVFLEELRRLRPGILSPLQEWARSRRAANWRVPATVLQRVPMLPVDRAVLERTRNALVLAARFRWSDVGTWEAIGKLLARDRRGNSSIGRLLAVGSSGCLGINPRGLTAFVGVRDVVAVRSGDLVLVCHTSAVQDVRRVVRRLSRGLRRYV